MIRRNSLTVVLGGLVLSACGGGDGGGDNMLPTASGTSASTSDTATSGSGSGTDTGAVGNVFPATFRFTCIDIQQIGESTDAVQINLLEDQWQSDIEAYKLNILVDVIARDDAGASATLQIRSGIGTSDADLCTHAATESAQHSGGFDAALGAHGPSANPTEEPCSSPSTEAMGGTYTLTTGNMDVFHIYAEDSDGTTFNCTSDPNVQDAVPVRAVTASFTQNEEGTQAWGSLSGCLVETEAEALCSCLGQCVGNAHEDCGGCPTGSVPLRTLLGTIQPDQACSDTMGVPAFNITLAFNADLLPAVPGSCG